MSENATVDSLQKFSLNKKKFSFSKKQNDDLESSENEQEYIPKLKGSAKLKQSDSEESDSYTKKKKKHVHKKRLDSGSEDEQEKREKNLKKLYKMFVDESTEKIKDLFISQNYDAKKCIDFLLKEKKKSNNDSLSIDEWSDGDENIRAKNRQAKEEKEKRLSDESNKSTESSSTSQSKKRKLLPIEQTSKQPSQKKRKKVIIASDSDENDDAKSSSSSQASSSKSSKLDSEDEAPVKKTKKKVIVKSSSDEEEEETSKPTKSKKSKKSKETKKKSKKNKRNDSESNTDQDDDDYNKNNYSDDDSQDSDSEEKLTDEQRLEVLNLFNKSSAEDIHSMINISAKRLELLISLRPFRNYAHLEKQLKEKSLAPPLKSIKEIIYARSIVSVLLNKCVKISEQMEQKVTTLIEMGNENSSLEVKFQPKLLNTALSLKPYQLIGLNWLCLLYKENINGILADEMGLGKTCQTIAFLTHLYEVNPKLMHLIVVPPSTLDNWIREISTWSPNFYFTVYQGSIEERRVLRYNILNNKFEKPLNAILSTYNLLHSTNEDKGFFKKLKFEYCIFDEAHMLKNMNSQRYQSLDKLRSKRRLLLTGTPLQNNLVELMSLLYFVMPDMFNHKTQYVNKIFASKPSNLDMDTFYNDKIAQAKGIMKPFILRRIKTEVLKQLPKKTEEIIYCNMTQRQQKEYNNLIAYYKKRQDQLVEKTKEKAEALDDKLKAVPQKYTDEILDIVQSDIKHKRELENEKKNKENEDSPNNILMELRKAANHPLLRRSLYDDEKLKKMAKLVMKESSPGTVYEYVLEDMSVMSDFELHRLCPLYQCLKEYALPDQTIIDSGKFVILNSILEEKKEMGDRCLIFSQFVIMLDIVEEFLKIKNYKYIRLDGTTAVTDRQDLIDNFNQDNEIFIFLLTTKAGGVGINLTAANTVILHDIDYNPFNDKQAEDRCHRLGQTREVKVYKLLSKSSIDEMMLKIQRKKLELGADISGTNDESEAKSSMVSMLKEALKL